MVSTELMGGFNQIYIILSLVHDKELLTYYELDLIFKVIAGFYL